MKISLLCNDSSHPVNEYLVNWINHNSDFHEISLLRNKTDLIGGDILFLVSCSDIIKADERKKYKYCLLLHASDLPRGRGWSPHVWEIINGAEQITVSLLEVEQKVDSGRIWKKITTAVPKHALWNEINEIIFSLEIDLIDLAVNSFYKIKPKTQASNVIPTYFKRRSPLDSRLDPGKSIKDQFDSIRVCDPLRYPAFFEMHGERFKLIIEKMDE